jgi:hypothetical protein
MLSQANWVSAVQVGHSIKGALTRSYGSPTCLPHPSQCQKVHPCMAVKERTPVH